MKDEIKEILKLDEQLLDKIENILASELNNEEYDTFYNYFNEIRKPNILVDIKDVDSVKDYITNLQDKIKQYEDPEDLTLFYMWLDEKAKDKMKQLQDRIKELEQINEEHRELNGALRKTINEAIEYLKYQIPQLDFEKDMKAKMLGAMVLVLLQGSDE